MITATIATITPGDVPVLLSVGEPVAAVPEEEEAVVVVVVGLGVEEQMRSVDVREGKWSMSEEQETGT